MVRKSQKARGISKNINLLKPHGNIQSTLHKIKSQIKPESPSKLATRIKSSAFTKTKKPKKGLNTRYVRFSPKTHQLSTIKSTKKKSSVLQHTKKMKLWKNRPDLANITKTVMIPAKQNIQLLIKLAKTVHSTRTPKKYHKVLSHYGFDINKDIWYEHNFNEKNISQTEKNKRFKKFYKDWLRSGWN